ncbi:MAG: type IV toxin-antitoxin system AbiEi family antitoxin domain-containing protein [Thermodesulfovibrionales bacterium]
MEKIIKYFRSHSGYAKMKELKKASFQTRDIAHLLQEGIIVKVKPGLYRLANFKDVVLPAITINANSYTISVGIMDVCRAIPEGVICLASALELYGLTTFNPSEIYVAIPNASKKPKIEYPPVKIFYFRDRFYRTGIEKIKAGDVTVNIYNREKTICDVFRYRNKIGEDIALEGLKNYMLRKDANINKLREYAEICRVKTIMMPYLKALIKQ